MSNYFEWNDFSNIYFEDSFVLEINESSNDIVFRVDFVLKENHPLFKLPEINEHYCYHKGALIFSEVVNKCWVSRSDHIYSDANDDEDLGNIDVFEKTDDRTYRLSGDWGEVIVTSARVLINYEKL